MIPRLSSICGLVLGVAASASSAPLPFSGTFRFDFGALPVLTSTGAGVGDFSGAGGAASIPANVFSIAMTAPIDPPLLVIDGLGYGAPGQGGFDPLPFAPGSNKALAFGGTTGTMGLDLSAYLLTGLGGPSTNAAAAIPLAIVGVGCTGPCPPPPIGMATVVANPYQLGMVTVMGAFQGVPSTVMGTGFDNRTAGGAGVLQLVSPAVVPLGALGSFAALATLTIQIVPEPATALLVGFGLAGLGALRARFRARSS